MLNYRGWESMGGVELQRVGVHGSAELQRVGVHGRC